MLLHGELKNKVQYHAFLSINVCNIPTKRQQGFATVHTWSVVTSASRLHIILGFSFSVAVEMIANKLFQQFLDQMEAKVGGCMNFVSDQLYMIMIGLAGPGLKCVIFYFGQEDSTVHFFPVLLPPSFSLPIYISPILPPHNPYPS